MHIDHIALWTSHLDEMKAFYERYFQAMAGNKYENPSRQFTSYFLSFPSGARLEIMMQPNIAELNFKRDAPYQGFIHIAISTGNEESVNRLTNQIQNDGYLVLAGPRRTGDGYYESVILDPDGNQVEITV
jgi:lactoylglutathione lyase